MRSATSLSEQLPIKRERRVAGGRPRELAFDDARVRRGRSARAAPDRDSAPLIAAASARRIAGRRPASRSRPGAPCRECRPRPRRRPRGGAPSPRASRASCPRRASGARTASTARARRASRASVTRPRKWTCVCRPELVGQHLEHRAVRAVAERDPAPRPAVERAVIAHRRERAQQHVEALARLEPSDAEQHAFAGRERRAAGAARRVSAGSVVARRPARRSSALGIVRICSRGMPEVPQDDRLERPVGGDHRVGRARADAAPRAAAAGRPRA